MKQIFIFLLAMVSVIPLRSHTTGASALVEVDPSYLLPPHDWDSLGYDNFYVTYMMYFFTDVFEDYTYDDYEKKWENDDYVFLRTCEYCSNQFFGDFNGKYPYNRFYDGYASGVCIANTLTDMKSKEISDNLSLPSIPEINLFFVDLAFVTAETERLNSITIPNMIRGIYNSSGKVLYVDTLYVEGDYECMFNNVERPDNGTTNFTSQRISPALIPAVVVCDGQPVRHFTTRRQGCGLDSEGDYLNNLNPFQWGDNFESFECADWSNPYRGINKGAFKNNKTLKRFKTALASDYHVQFESEAFYGCENLEVCDLEHMDLPDVTTRTYKHIDFGDSVFAYCTKLDTFRYNGATDYYKMDLVGNAMFYGCKNLRYFHNWNEVKEIGAGAFSGCENLSLKADTLLIFHKVGDSAFLNCNKFVCNVAVEPEPYPYDDGDGGSIGDSAFKGSGIKSARIMDIKVESNAFDDCYNLNHVTIVSQIMNRYNRGGYIPDFHNCPNLKTIYVVPYEEYDASIIRLSSQRVLEVINSLDTLYMIGARPDIVEEDYPKYNFPNTVLCVDKGMKSVYLENPNVPTFKAIVELGGDPVGIEDITVDDVAGEDDADAPVYDLSGQRVLKTIPGNVYVSKGRKFIAK